MATLNSVIERVDDKTPNAFTNEQKAEWLWRFDGKVSSEIMDIEPPKVYQFPDDGEKTLLIPEPYDMIYDHHLEAMIAYYQDEIDKYNNCNLMCQTLLEEYAKYYIRHHEPKSFYNFNNVM